MDSHPTYVSKAYELNQNKLQQMHRSDNLQSDYQSPNINSCAAEERQRGDRERLLASADLTAHPNLKNTSVPKSKNALENTVQSFKISYD